MKRISIDDVKERILELIDQLDEGGVIITKDDAPVAKLTKCPGRFAQYIGSMKGEIKIHGDIFSTGVHYPENCDKVQP